MTAAETSSWLETAERLWSALEPSSGAEVDGFDRSTIDGLPEPARRFLVATVPDGSPLATAVELEMTGRIKLGIWLPFRARQIVRSGVGLVWVPDVGGRVLRFVGADTLGPDGARMQFRFHDRIPVVDASGPNTVRSAAGRLAAETVAWLPHALTPQAGATWKALDERRATVTLPGGPTGPTDVDVTIDERGHLTEIRLQRWNDSAEPPRLAPFGGVVSASLDVDGVRIARDGAVGWAQETEAQELEDQEWAVFFRYRITSARFLP